MENSPEAFKADSSAGEERENHVPTETMDERLPAVLITGFLGSGKTTMLKRWLTDAPATGYRLGIVMNEFGEVNVDREILGQPDLPMMSVEGGCVCCAPDNELERACSRLAKSGACDVIVIETSGLADPDNVIDVLTDPDLHKRVRLQAVVTVVDARWWLETHEEADMAERVLARKQLMFAHVIALSHCDALVEDDRDRVGDSIRAMNPDALLVRMPFDLPDLGKLLERPPADVVLSIDDPVEVAGEDKDSAHLHHKYQSVSWRFPVPVERSALERFLRELDPRVVVRTKGFVRLRHAPEKLFLFQSVFGHVLLDEFPAWPHPEPVAVFIGPGLDADNLRKRLRSVVFGPGGAVPIALNGPVGGI
jgi:G3E family GTPase